MLQDNLKIAAVIGLFENVLSARHSRIFEISKRAPVDIKPHTPSAPAHRTRPSSESGVQEADHIQKSRMSLLPLIYNDNWYSMRPSRVLDLDDLLVPISTRLLRCPAGYYRPWSSAASGSDAGSTITADKGKFQVSLDVQHFKPDEVTVNVGGDTITVEGKHEEKKDEHGFISRHFVRKYVLPQGHDTKNIVSSLSSDGVLSITAPRVNQEGVEERTIPIQQTGVPSKPIKGKEQKKDKMDES